MESVDRIHSLTKRSLKLKNIAVDCNQPKDRQRRAIRLWLETLFSLKKSVRKSNKSI